MAGRVLVDTNVLVYFADERDLIKRERAEHVLTAFEASGRGFLSQQVLSEFARVASESIPDPPSAAELTQVVLDFSRTWPILAITPDIVADALGIAERTGRSFWDAQLIATARANGIGLIVSEDFEDGAVCEGVRFADPFAPGFEASVLSL